MGDLTAELRARVERAFREGAPLAIRGGGSKGFYGPPAVGEPLATGGHRGVIHFDPREQVITARSGTPLAALEAIIGAERLMLACDPPHFAAGATVGGMVAAGLSGPRRPWLGAVRDSLLGVRMVNGRGELLRFGGEVIKNVAGYDLSRLMAGALGTLGLLLEVSLRLTPRPERELTLVRECPEAEAIEQMRRCCGRSLPLAGSCHEGGRLYLRLCGSERAVAAAGRTLGGEPLAEGERFWLDLREQQLPFFAGEAPLFRLTLPADLPPLALGPCLTDWGGAQRWLRSHRPAAAIRAAAARLGGHATLFRGGGDSERFPPPAPALLALQRRLKAAFDPAGVLNPGRLHAQL